MFQKNESPEERGACAECGDILSVRGMTPFIDRNLYPSAEERIFVFKTLESTNRTAKEMLFEGAADGTLVFAEGQRRGRGRLGRTFFSPPGKGLYMSMILRPKIHMDRAPALTAAASVAVCRAIGTACGLDARIKWINDILIDGRKVCGILAEVATGIESGEAEGIIIGIGVNRGIAARDMPEDIRETAGSLPASTSVNLLAAEIVNEFMKIMEYFGSEGMHPEYIDEYRKRSCVLGKEIMVFGNEPGRAPLKAEAVDITDEGGLAVIYSDGRRDVLISGEISIRLL